MQHEVLLTAGAIDVPERFAGEAFGGSVILRTLGADGKISLSEVRLGFGRIFLNLVEHCTILHIGTFATVRISTLQNTLANRA